MGNVSVPPFIRNDKIEGQGKSVLLVAKNAHIKNSELDRLFEKFKSMTGPDVDYIQLHEFFMAHSISFGVFKCYCFEQFAANGFISFEAFVISLWALLATSDDLLSAYCFNMFDTRRSNSLVYTEIEIMVNLIYDFDPPFAALAAISHLATNPHGVVTLPEFVLLCRHFPIILEPVHQFREQLKKRVIFYRFWRQLTVRRVYYWGEMHAFDILGTLTVQQQIAALERLLDHNTNHWIPPDITAKWQEVVASKPTDIVEKLPFEIDPTYLPPLLPIAQPKIVKITPEQTSMYKEKAEESSKMGAISSRSTTMMNNKVGGGGSVVTANTNNSKSTQPYVARKPVVEDDRDIKKLLRKINKEVKRHVAMSKIDSRSVGAGGASGRRGSKIAPSAPSSASHSVMDDDGGGLATPSEGNYSRRMSVTSNTGNLLFNFSGGALGVAAGNDDDINDPEDPPHGTINMDDDYYSSSHTHHRRTTRRRSNAKRSMYSV